MKVPRHAFSVLLALSAVVTASCENSENSEVMSPQDSVITTDSLPTTDDTVLIAVADADECATALAAFSAVSNILMSGLAKPSSFEADRYVANLELTRDVITSDIESDYVIFVDGYGAAGEALATAREVGAGTSKGEVAIDKATAILNDVAVTSAAERVARFLSSDCGVNK